MSRSIKKTPVCKEQASRWIKRQASKAVRRYPHDISFGKSYRKIFSSWDISDWWFYTPYKKAVNEWETTHKTWRKQVSFQEMTFQWAKSFKRK
ncbi:hypothetical protein C173_09118 [Paenibacillus sp. FSL R7-277]|uniref:Transposase n=1 Tax=Paenibacillus silagei TaxID=1670801 RepID=A0ABS4NQN5_9BACL|nr:MULTISPECIES: hypothetical protein [Paenibacillus]ETT74243.1 hypothetical protein C173_09118 [Paenibacillus sp. FSL R7-277]MBP2111715.1 hypothetical protein [Paenibacillus silagei]